jgi:hypothetical protein
VLKEWLGPVTIAHLAPYGGLLIAGEPPDRSDVSLLLAASEVNGMTFGDPGGERGTAALLADALASGIDDPAKFEPLVQFHSTLGGGGGEWVPGTAVWLPEWGGGDARHLVVEQLGPLHRFGLLAGSGCLLDSLPACDSRSRAIVPDMAGDVFSRFVVAAGHELEGKPGTNEYDAVALALRKAASADTAGPGAARARDVLGDIAELVDKVASGEEERRLQRRVVLLRMGVENYDSPLVADLAGTSKDLEAYEAAFRAALRPRASAVEVRDRMVPDTAESVLAALRAERDALGPNDLLILVYSGRGIEIAGRRYVAPSGIKPSDLLSAFAGDRGLADWDPDSLVDLWQIADIMRDRWFVGLYDAQFTTPLRDSDRVDQLLDKHVDSVRPIMESPAQSEERLDTSAAFEVRSRGEVPTKQLHIWVEGTLTAAASPPLDCIGGEDAQAGELSSPLAAATLLSLLSPTGSYRDWLAALARSPCLVDAGLRLVAQGDLDVPLLASGEGAELVDFFHKDLARSVANLRAAYGAIDEVSAPFPSDRNRIAAAGVLLAIATLQLQHTDTLLWVDPLSQAAERLDAADLTDLSPEEADGLRALRMELRARRAVLAGDVEEARRELREAQPASILEERGLAVRLVALSAESMRRQPATFLEDTLQKLDELDRELFQSGAQVGVTTARRAREQLEELLLLEQRRQAGAFSIKPPTTAR